MHALYYKYNIKYCKDILSMIINIKDNIDNKSIFITIMEIIGKDVNKYSIVFEKLIKLFYVLIVLLKT
jgi:hypothetical protein